MDSLLASAILNNAHWCDVVCRLNNVSGTFQKKMWISTREVPHFYPNIITLSPLASNADSLNDLYSILQKSASPFSIKDSFGELDLKDLKFKKIIDAQWIGYEQKMISGSHSSWQRIHFPKRFEVWVESWKKYNKTTTSPFPLSTQKENDIWICGEYSSNDFIKGAVLFLHNNSVGVSNIFSTEKIDYVFWNALIQFISTQFPGLPIVGYESGSSLNSSIQAGFTPLGQLAVWEKGNRPPAS